MEAQGRSTHLEAKRAVIATCPLKLPRPPCVGRAEWAATDLITPPPRIGKGCCRSSWASWGSPFYRNQSDFPPPQYPTDLERQGLTHAETIG